MKPKSYALKPWWPRTIDADPSPTTTLTRLDPLAVFRQQVAIEVRRLGLPVKLQDYVVSAVAGLDIANLRPDLARQAREWITQHRQMPRARYRRRRPSPLGSGRGTDGDVSNHLPQSAPRHQPSLKTLAREAFVTRMLEVEHQPIKQVALQLRVTREIVRQIHARARRRRREEALQANEGPQNSLHNLTTAAEGECFRPCSSPLNCAAAGHWAASFDT